MSNVCHQDCLGSKSRWCVCAKNGPNVKRSCNEDAPDKEAQTVSRPFAEELCDVRKMFAKRRNHRALDKQITGELLLLLHVLRDRPLGSMALVILFG